MTFKFSFHVDPEGMTVLYPPRIDDIRRNLGIADLRKEPDKASEIAVGVDSPALCSLLVRVAKKGSPIFTSRMRPGYTPGTHKRFWSSSRSCGRVHTIRDYLLR